MAVNSAKQLVIVYCIVYVVDHILISVLGGCHQPMDLRDHHHCLGHTPDESTCQQASIGSITVAA